MSVMTDPWGSQQPAADIGADVALPPRLARLADVQATGIALTAEDAYAQGFPAADELAEVQTLMREGWRPLDGAPLYCLLPAAWPAEYRAWVPDRLPKVGMAATTDAYWSTIVALPEDDDDRQDDYPGERARAVGLPQPPTDRIWLLRSPWPSIAVTVIYEIIWSVVERAAGRDEIAQVYRVAKDVLTWDEERALNACPAETRELVDSWAQAGRVGEAAATVIEQRLRPADLDDALSRTQLDEQTLLDWLTSLETDLDDDAITFINAWRSAGLPGNPPSGAIRFTDRDPAEVRAWLDASFDLYAAAQLRLAGLDTATRWRDAGFNEADTYELLRSDPALNPEEARAFDSAGPAREHRREWIYYGFNATQAEDWAATGLTPAEARLWRACDKQPADVHPGQGIPSQLSQGRRHIGISRSADGEISHPGWDDLDDPPGTRGRRARRRAGDDDPWINTD
jgi:hypothetical protein